MQVQALLAGWRRGLVAAQQEPEIGAQLLSAGVDMSPQAYLAVGKGLRFYSPAESLAMIAGAPPALGQASERLVRTLQLIGVIRDTPDWGRLLAAGPAQRALEQRKTGA